MIVMSPLDRGQREQAPPRWVGLVRVQAGGLEADFDNALASARCNVVAFAADGARAGDVFCASSSWLSTPVAPPLRPMRELESFFGRTRGRGVGLVMAE